MAGETPSSSGSARSREPLLLHACCAPCSLEPLRLLRAEGFEPTILWSNPNIQPLAEHERRLSTLLRWAGEVAHVEVIVAGDDRDAWERDVAPLWERRRERCRACYALRLEELCRVACARGFACVSTTLAVSPYQLFDVCSEVLVERARSHGLTPVVRDFRPYYPAACEEARSLCLYRQCYCGCRFSAADAAHERHVGRDRRAASRRERAHETAVTS